MKEDKQDTSNSKMKGLLKGLRYISQIFDNEKEAEIQIGYPTDVKHVAHIGWEGPSTVNKPSWMGEFKSPTGFGAVSPGSNSAKDDSNVKYDFEDPHKKPKAQNTSSSQASDGPDAMTKSTKRTTSSGNGSATPDKTTSKEKHKSKRPSRNTSKDSLDSSKQRSKESSRRNASKDNSALDQTENVPADLPKKTPKKRSKDPSAAKETRSSSRSKAETSES